MHYNPRIIEQKGASQSDTTSSRYRLIHQRTKKSESLACDPAGGSSLWLVRHLLNSPKVLAFTFFNFSGPQ